MKIKAIPISAAAFLVITIITTACAQKKVSTSVQIEQLLKEKQSRTAIQKKIDSQLLQAIKERQGKKMMPDVDLTPANVHVDNKGNVNVDIAAEVTDTLQNKIKALGGIIVFPSKEYHTIKAKINLAMIEKIAAFPEVKFIAPASVPYNNQRPAPGAHSIPVKPGQQP